MDRLRKERRELLNRMKEEVSCERGVVRMSVDEVFVEREQDEDPHQPGGKLHPSLYWKHQNINSRSFRC